MVALGRCSQRFAKQLPLRPSPVDATRSRAVRSTLLASGRLRRPQPRHQGVTRRYPATRPPSSYTATPVVLGP